MQNQKLDLFDLLRSLNLPIRDYAVFGSGPLIVRGVIEATNDLDLISRGDAWRMAEAQGLPVTLPDGVVITSLFDGLITIGKSWGIGEFDLDALIDTAELIDGIPFVRLEHVVAYKRIAGRRKDRRHLDLLEASEHGSLNQ